MLRFCSLGSGSSGNATLVEARSGATVTRLLIDCGLSLRELDARLGRLGLVATDLDAVFVTHEHSDHVGSAAALSRRHGLPVWSSHGTWRACGEDLGERWSTARDGEPVSVGDLQILPYTVPHDAREPLQLSAVTASRVWAFSPTRARTHPICWSAWPAATRSSSSATTIANCFSARAIRPS